MTLKIAKQAHCIEVLRQWLDVSDALESVTALDTHFNGFPINVSGLVRELVERHPQIGKGALFAKLSKNMASLDLNADYFRAARYASTIGEHVALHQSFHIMVEEFIGGLDSHTATDSVASILRDSALTSTLPGALAEKVAVAASTVPIHAPLGLGIAELEWIIGKLYVRLCASVGPEIADKSLARALDRARHEEPSIDPHRFL